ncbi:MAG: hypothetical protein HY820_39580 [Acidobacteria bacterium]|nr:hypothetical protein [Acidobacteriota bacterium]
MYSDRNIEEHIDVLQNIEAGIMAVYRVDKSLLDVDAKDAIDALIRCYHAEEEGRRAPYYNLAARAQTVFDSVKPLCEMRLGRESAPDDAPSESISISVLVSCLRTIQKSIVLWNKEGGRKGYLDFISRYVL